MKVFRNIKIKGIKTAVAIGFFDGIHVGHKKVILKAVDSGFLPVVLTFDFSNCIPNSKQDFKFIYENKDKFSLLEKLKVKLVVVPFFEQIKNLSFVDFFYDILIKQLNAKLIVCGENLKFGRDRKGDIEILRALSNINNIDLKVIKLEKIDGIVVSSKRIRKEIENANFLVVEKLLGRKYYINFKIEKIFKIDDIFVVFMHIKKERAFVREGKYLADMIVLGIRKEVIVVVEKISGDFFLKINIKRSFKQDILGCCARLIFLKKIQSFS